MKILLFILMSMSPLLWAQDSLMELKPPFDPEQPNVNWKYRFWGDYKNPKLGIAWYLGKIAPKISKFWKINSIPVEGSVSAIEMTYHQWSLRLDAYPQDSNVTGRDKQVIYSPGQPPKKTIEIYLPELQKSVEDYKELGDVDKEPLYGAHSKIKAYVQRFSGKPIRPIGEGKTETSKDTYIYEFWVTDKASSGYQFVTRVEYPEIYMKGKDPQTSIKRFRKESQLVLSAFDYCDQDKDWKENLEKEKKRFEATQKKLKEKLEKEKAKEEKEKAKEEKEK
jgi:hypothetical protein